MRRIARCLAGAALSALVALAAGEAAAEVKIRFATTIPEAANPETKAMKALEEFIEFRSVGEMQVELFFGGALGGDRELLEQVQNDTLQIGYTALWPGIGIFPDWLRHKEYGLVTKVVEVKGGLVHWSDRLKLPVRPMVGVIGVAPIHGSVITIDNGTHGGNLDIQEIGPGNSITLPVWHEGAHLFMGDCHAIQGDGEVQSVGGIEVAAAVTASVELLPKPARLTWPRIETPTHIVTMGCARPLDDALRLAFQEMIFWLADEHGFSEQEAYLLLGQIAEARCTQMVNPKYTYVCKVDRRYLA